MIKKEDLKLVNETIKAFKKKHKKSQLIERQSRTGASTIGQNAGMATPSHIQSGLHEDYNHSLRSILRTYNEPRTVRVPTRRTGLIHEDVEVPTAAPDPLLFGIASSTYEQWQSNPIPVPTSLNAESIRTATRDAINHFTSRDEYQATVMNHIQEHQAALADTPETRQLRNLPGSISPLDNHVEHIRQHINELSDSSRMVPFDEPHSTTVNYIRDLDRAAHDAIIYRSSAIRVTAEDLGAIPTSAAGRIQIMTELINSGIVAPSEVLQPRRSVRLRTEGDE